MLAVRRMRRQLLHVVGDDHARRRALRTRDAQRAVDHVAHLLRRDHHLDVLARDVLEQRRQVHFLLEAAAERGARRLADDRDHRLMVELRVVESVQQVDGTRAGSRQADADLPGEFRVRARHERRHLLVADLDEIELVAGAVQRPEDAVDAVARVPVDPLDAPFTEALQQEVADRRAHCVVAAR